MSQRLVDIHDSSSSDDEKQLDAAPSMGGKKAYVGTHHHGAARTTHGSKAFKRKIFLGFNLVSLCAIAAWLLYLLVALVLNVGRALPLAVCTFVCLGVHALVETGNYEKIKAATPPVPGIVSWIILALLSAVAAGVVIWQIARDAEHRQYRLQALLGTAVFCGLCIALSQRMRTIPWQLVLSAGLVQFFLGYFVLRTEVGFTVFKTLGDGVSAFLDLSDFGAAMVFGDEYRTFFFAFKVLPTTIFFSAFISAMYYLGVMQVFVRITALFLKKTIGASLIQSVNAAANLFLGMTEAPLLIKPFLPKASPNDIHCVMVGGFASIAGGVLAAYIGMGVKAEQLIGASVMSVPGTLLVSNLVVPPGSMEESVSDDSNSENGDNEAADSDHFEFPPCSENNIIEAAGNGAHIAIDLVLNIGAMLIAFLALLKVVDGVLGYLGGLVDIEGLCFQLICSYVFFPVAWLLGAPYNDCFEVATLIGTKIFLNEFVAYKDLAKLLEHPDGSLLSPRGEMTATYALCGFSNVGSIGVTMGALSTLCPERQSTFAKLVISAMISGNVVCFLTATMAGVLS